MFLNAVSFQLPLAQLEGALNKIPALKAPLAAHANQQNLKSTLPRFVQYDHLSVTL